MDVDDLRLRMEASRTRLLAAITGLTEEQARARPAEGGRCVNEILAHLMMSEGALSGAAREALGGTVAASPAPAPEPPGRSTPLPQLVHGLLAARRKTLRLLEALDPAHLSRPCVASGLGRVTVRRLFEHVAAHEEEHAAEIEARRSTVIMKAASEGSTVILRPAGRSE